MKKLSLWRAIAAIALATTAAVSACAHRNNIPDTVPLTQPNQPTTRTAMDDPPGDAGVSSTGALPRETQPPAGDAGAPANPPPTTVPPPTTPTPSQTPSPTPGQPPSQSPTMPPPPSQPPTTPQPPSQPPTTPEPPSQPQPPTAEPPGVPPIH